MRIGITTLNIKDDTEVLVVDLPELRDLPRGRWIVFMVGTQDVTFAVTGHDADGTYLVRVRNVKGE